jgi:DNA-binding response OmpR family regulator
MADNVNRVLIVEEDEAVVGFVAKVAKRVGYAVASAATGAGFVQLLDSFQPSLVIMELHLPDTDGVELLRSLGARGCTANVVLIGNVDERVLSAAHELGLSHGLAMCGTLEKPIDVAALSTKLTAMLHQSGVRAVLPTQSVARANRLGRRRRRGARALAASAPRPRDAA